MEPEETIQENDSPEYVLPPHIKNKHTDDLVDHYWGSLLYLQNLIKSSEIKAGLILSFYGILLNFIYNGASVINTKIQHHIILDILFALWFACTVISIYFSIRCFIPRIEAKYEKNVFFFNDVITKFGTIKQFSKTFYQISLNEELLFDQLGQQIFIISKIAAVKFKNVNLSLRFLALGLFVFLCIVVFYVSIKVL